MATMPTTRRRSAARPAQIRAPNTAVERPERVLEALSAPTSL